MDHRSCPLVQGDRNSLSGRLALSGGGDDQTPRPRPARPGDPGRSTVSRRAVDATLETVVGLIGRAQSAGFVDPRLDADALGRVLTGAFQGLVVQTVIGAPPERERHISALRTLLRSCSPRTPESG